jgi:hypothetical protein
MVTAEQARLQLSLHGIVQPQLPNAWSGGLPLAAVLERYYREVGPVDVCIESFGNPFFLPSLARLWSLQAGYRWNGLSGEPVADWQDDWLVVAHQGGDPFILSRSSGTVLHDQHGRGRWEPGELFPDLNAMAGCLGFLGSVVVSAGENLADEDFRIRPACRHEAITGLQRLLGSAMTAEVVLESLGWG